MNILDLVKHACKTVLATLEECDRFALVQFNHEASELVELSPVTPALRKRAMKAIETMKHGGGTGLWDGVKTSLDCLVRAQASDAADGNHNGAAVLLLTDGEPSDGTDQARQMRTYLEQQQHPLTFSMNTFGFGYSLNSELLNDLACTGDGMFSFIPDAGFVGTTFVNVTANLLATLAQDVALELQASSAAPAAPAAPSLVGSMLSAVSSGLYRLVNGPHAAALAALPVSEDVAVPTVQVDARYRWCLGPVAMGQPRTVVVRVPAGATLQVEAAYTTGAGLRVRTPAVLTRSTAVAAPGDAASLEVAAARMRQEVCHALKHLVPMTEKKQLIPGLTASGNVTTLLDSLRASPAATEPAMQALCEDVEGQVAMASSTQEFFQKWGRHYLRSLARCHTLQQANNFKVRARVSPCLWAWFVLCAHVLVCGVVGLARTLAFNTMADRCFARCRTVRTSCF